MGIEPIDYAATIADLEAKRNALDAAITAFRTAQALGALGVSVGESMNNMADGVSVALLPSGEVPVGAFLGKSIPDAAKLCLQIVKRKMTSREIAEYLRKGGIESTAKNFPALVHSILIRASRAGNGIVKLDRSYWALGEWYPASMRTAGASEKRPYKRRKGRTRKSETATEPKQKNSSTGAASRIAQVLRGEPGTEFSAEDVVAPANVTVRVARLMLGKLVASKQAAKTDSGKYRATVVN